MYFVDRSDQLTTGTAELMKSIRASLVFTLLFMCATLSSYSSSGQSTFTGTVSPIEAQFVLAISHRDGFQWYRKDTRDNAREYRAEVLVHNGDKDYRFGFYLWKFPENNRPKTGDLAALVKAGQSSLFLIKRGGGGQIVLDAGIRVKAQNDSLIISVEGRKNVERLFSSRPDKVTFNIEIPQEGPISQTVNVLYKDR